MDDRLSAKEKRDRDLYNLLPGEREKIRAFQGGKDPITNEPLKPNANCDHDHRTGLIRGLLNPMTNKRLNDNIEQIRRTLEYLINPPAVQALGEEVFGVVGRAVRKRKILYGPDRTPAPRPRRTRTVEVSTVQCPDLQPRQRRSSRTRSTVAEVRRAGSSGNMHTVLPDELGDREQPVS